MIFQWKQFTIQRRYSILLLSAKQKSNERVVHRWDRLSRKLIEDHKSQVYQHLLRNMSQSFINLQRLGRTWWTWKGMHQSVRRPTSRSKLRRQQDQGSLDCLEYQDRLQVLREHRLKSLRTPSAEYDPKSSARKAHFSNVSAENAHTVPTRHYAAAGSRVLNGRSRWSVREINAQGIHPYPKQWNGLNEGSCTANHVDYMNSSILIDHDTPRDDKGIQHEQTMVSNRSRKISNDLEEAVRQVQDYRNQLERRKKNFLAEVDHE